MLTRATLSLAPRDLGSSRTRYPSFATPGCSNASVSGRSWIQPRTWSQPTPLIRTLPRPTSFSPRRCRESCTSSLALTRQQHYQHLLATSGGHLLPLLVEGLAPDWRPSRLRTAPPASRQSRSPPFLRPRTSNRTQGRLSISSQQTARLWTPQPWPSTRASDCAPATARTRSWSTRSRSLRSGRSLGRMRATWILSTRSTPSPTSGPSRCAQRSPFCHRL